MKFGTRSKVSDYQHGLKDTYKSKLAHIIVLFSWYVCNICNKNDKKCITVATPN